MGSIVSYLMGFMHSNDELLDEKSGLTVKQKRLVQQTWKIVGQTSVHPGVTIMISFFTKYPKYQNEFNSFRGIPLEQLRGSKKFQAHCNGIVSTLSSGFDSLEDIELMEEILIVTGERHGRRGQTYQAFYDLKPIILDFLESKLEHKFDPEVTLAWDKTLDFTFAQIIRGMRNVLDN